MKKNLDGNYMCFEQILEATLYKQKLWGHLCPIIETIQLYEEKMQRNVGK